LSEAACHLTSEEDSYGNQKGNQTKVEQQSNLTIPRQREEKHPLVRG